jgi:hypothetical protein
MKQWLLFAIACISVIFAAGCATGYTRVSMVSDDSFGAYQAVEVPDLRIGRKVPDELKKRIPTLIVKALKKEHLFSQMEQSDTITGVSVLVCQGRIIQFDPGDRFRRYMAGPLLGMGKGSLIVNMKFIDKSSSKVLAECNFEGEIKGGFFGGGFEDTYQEVAKAVVRFIKTNM